MKTFNEVRKFLFSIPNIDCGGCGIATLAMYRWLKKNKSVKNVGFHFLHDNYDGYLYRSNKTYAETKEGEPTACSHVGLIINDKTFDSGRRIMVRKYPNRIKIYDENFLLLAVNNLRDWNEEFNRKYIKKISKVLDIDLSDVRITY